MQLFFFSTILRQVIYVRYFILLSRRRGWKRSVEVRSMHIESLHFTPFSRTSQPDRLLFCFLFACFACKFCLVLVNRTETFLLLLLRRSDEIHFSATVYIYIYVPRASTFESHASVSKLLANFALSENDNGRYSSKRNEINVMPLPSRAVHYIWDDSRNRPEVPRVTAYGRNMTSVWAYKRSAHSTAKQWKAARNSFYSHSSAFINADVSSISLFLRTQYLISLI